MNWKEILKDSVHTIQGHHSAHWFRDKDNYAWWLSQTYHFVTHSTSLLGYSLPFLRDEKLRTVFEHHLGEESRHDLLALKDLEKLGRPLDPPSAFTEAFYQSQYYRIQFQSGEALLGYILFLENLAVSIGREVYAELNTLYPQSVLFLRIHAEEDISHVARAVALVESLSVETQRVIQENFHYSEELYLAVLSKQRSNCAKKIA